jgi:predicted GIY-YIG superfamily endonuclease
MVLCNDDSYYVGIASDVAERIKRHNWGALDLVIPRADGRSGWFGANLLRLAW